MGVDFTFDTLRTEGIRTLHITGLHAAAPLPGLGSAALDVDTLRVHLSLIDLLRGQLAVGEVHIGRGRLVLKELAMKTNGLGGPKTSSAAPSPLFKALPSFSIIGEDCAVELYSEDLEAPVLLQALAFTLSGKSGGAMISGEIQSQAAYANHTVDVNISGQYQPGNNFDVLLHVKGITTAAIRSFAAVPEGLDAGLDCAVHAWGNPEQQILADMEIQAKGLNYAGLPVPIQDEALSLKGLLQWDSSRRMLALRDGGLQSKLATLSLKGAVDFQQTPPAVALDALVSGLPTERFLPALIPESLQKQGKLELELSESPRIELTMSGPLNKPALKASIEVPNAEIGFQPEDKKYPKGEMRLAGAAFVWEDFSSLPEGTATIADGSVTSTLYGIQAEDITGTMSLSGSEIHLNPITASVSGKPVFARLAYGLSDGKLKGEVNGTLTQIEKTPLHHITKDLWIGGDIGFNISGEYTRGGAVKLTSSMDVTRGMVAFEWWLRKPAGVGATIKELNLAIVPGKTLDVQGEAYIEDTHVLGSFEYIRHQDKWQSRHIRVDIPHLEVNSAGKCINIPYTTTGGSCKDGFYESNAAGKVPGDKIDTLGGVFDHVSFLPDNGSSPLVCRDAKVSVTMNNIQGQPKTAELTVHAAEGHVPPFGETWLLPLGSDEPEYTDELALKYFEEEEEKKAADTKKSGQPVADSTRYWIFKLSADTITLPPWEGSNFVAEVHNSPDKTEFRSCSADIGGGHAEGTYVHEKKDNVGTLKATGKNIPARYPIRHLALPEILEGDLSGNISYAMDQDDPRTTLRAEGNFTITNGHFLADPLRDTFKQAFSDTFATLHPAALQFETASSDVRIEGDHVYTKNVAIQLPGMKIKGDGVWVMEGDMDYRVDIAVTPDMAEQLPILRDSFNVQGFRMTQRDIELGFHITGPTFNPTGELAGLPPVGVTLVSGAAEMTGEAMKLLDTPRQMLFSIFRIGGGILGATRTQQQQPQEKQEPEKPEKPRRRR